MEVDIYHRHGGIHISMALSLFIKSYFFKYVYERACVCVCVCDNKHMHTCIILVMIIRTYVM